MSWCRCSECIGGFAELSVKPGLRSSHRGGQKTAAGLLEAPQSPLPCKPFDRKLYDAHIDQESVLCCRAKRPFIYSAAF
jgi:hypothetical protein